MAIIECTGNIFDSEAQAIGHGVNVRGVMGAGIAAQFRDRYKDMYEMYRIACRRNELKPGGVFPWLTDRWVYNIASQDDLGANAKYHWLVEGTARALTDMEQRGLTSLALPQIGCGIGGLVWPDVHDLMLLLSRDFPSIDIELWTYQP